MFDQFLNESFTWIFRLRAASKAQVDGAKKPRTRDRGPKAYPAPEANAELQSNIDVSSIVLKKKITFIRMLMINVIKFVMVLNSREGV